MTKEFLRENAVTDLFDIIEENFVSQENLEQRDKNLESAIKTAKGGDGGEISEDIVATDSEVDEILDKYFGENEVATDEEADNILDKYFGGK